MSESDGASVKTYTYDANNRLLSEVEGTKTTTYTYDANGNQLSGNGLITYDARGRQSTWTNGLTTASYTYYPNDLRKSKTVGVITTNYVWDGQNMVYEYNGTNTTGGTAYYYGLTLISQGNYTYYLYNGHGDVVQLVTASGTLGRSYDYDAFGNEVSPSATDTNPFRYAGQYFDSETGTYYLRARYYDPGIGRFTQQDGWAFGDPSDPLSLNLYTYCWNNPINFIDVDGYDAILVNRHLNNFIGEKLGIEHTAAFFQDENGTWYYFSWENAKVSFQAVTDASIFDNLDRLNQYLANTPHEKLEYVMLDDTKNVPFITSVYIKGDFAQSVSAARKIYDEYCTVIDDKEDKSNSKYNLIFNNCSQVAVYLLKQGTLPSGIRVGHYLWASNRGTNILPDNVMNNLQMIFGNDALNATEFARDVQNLNWLNKWIVTGQKSW